MEACSVEIFASIPGHCLSDSNVLVNFPIAVMKFLTNGFRKVRFSGLGFEGTFRCGVEGLGAGI